MKNAVERETRKGWVVDRDTGEAIEVVGYYCDNPADPARVHPYWWCPVYGYSVPESSFHATHLAAAEEALRIASIKHKQTRTQIERYGLLVQALGGDPLAP